MKLKAVTQNFFECDSDQILSGPSVANCPRKDIEGAGDMLLTCDRRDSRKSNLVTTIYRSHDGGESWEFQSVFEHRFVYDLDGSSRRDGYGSLFSDEQRGCMIYLGTELYFENGNPKSPDTMRKVYYRISFDNGYTWSDKRQIIQKGISNSGQIYDKTHYMHGVKFGCNMALLAVPNVVRCRDLSLAFGICSQVTDSHWKTVDYTGAGFMQTGALKARWNSSALGYDFHFGDWAGIEVERSTRGLFEPMLAQVNGERLMMLARGSNEGQKDLIGCKFVLLSTDFGVTWSKPEPLLYEDGKVVYSSSSGARLLEHSNGKLYYIGVINDKNPAGNLPRYPLRIAEIDKYSCRVRRKGMLVIADKPEGCSDSDSKYYADFTGHGVYEDSEGHIVVLAPCRPDLNKFGGHINKYVIEV